MAFGLFYVGIRFFCCIFNSSRKLQIINAKYKDIEGFKFGYRDIKDFSYKHPKVNDFCELNNTYEKPTDKLS